MSLYNALHGVNPCTFFIMPMLGEKHPDSYPRFRDCFINDEDHPQYKDHIHVYTRVGGNNRGEGFGEEELYKHPNFVTSFDDDFDSTYATYVFSIPEEWKQDFELVKTGKIKEVSKKYQERVRKVFPKLNDKLNELWGKEEANA